MGERAAAAGLWEEATVRLSDWRMCSPQRERRPSPGCESSTLGLQEEQGVFAARQRHPFIEPDTRGKKIELRNSTFPVRTCSIGEPLSYRCR